MDFWTPRTLADDMSVEASPAAPPRTLEAMGTLAADDGPVPPPPSPIERIACVCGRLCWPIEMVDVSGLPEELTGGAGYRCCGCRSAWVRNGAITRAGLLEGLGAPPGMVQRAREIPHVP